MAVSRIEDIIEDIRQGKMVILMDDEGRENEGDLIMAAQWVRPEDVNFMAAYGRGLVCLTLTRERCAQLRLPLMVIRAADEHATNFTVSIEAARGVTTGISAADRAVTIRAAVAADAGPADVVQPGHIFPLMAQPGGVLSRAGHTEAGCDLARLAGLEPASAIVEILNPDGSMARRPELEKFAQQHGLRIGTIADLIEYRIRNERNVERVAECAWPTDQGDFKMVVFRDTIEGELHFALCKGEWTEDQAVMTRVHMREDLSDVLGGRRAGMPLPLTKAMARIAEEGAGVVLILRHTETASDLLNRVRNYHLEDQGGILPHPEPTADLRTYGVGAQILRELGVRRMQVMSAPKKIHALSGFGLEVVGYVYSGEAHE